MSKYIYSYIIKYINLAGNEQVLAISSAASRGQDISLLPVIRQSRALILWSVRQTYKSLPVHTGQVDYHAANLVAG